jgi:hypothetical protein
VWTPDHWAFAGTELHYGDHFGQRDAIVAYEVDGCELRMRCGIPIPTHRDGAPETLEILASALRACGRSMSSDPLRRGARRAENVAEALLAR